MITRTSVLAAAVCCFFAGVISADGDSRITRCSVEEAYHCYRNVSKNFVIDRLLPAHADGRFIFGDLCAKKTELPLEPKCKDLYSGCLENDKRKFILQEKGYAFLQSFSTDISECSAPSFLHICVDIDVMKNCTLERPDESESLYVLRKKNYALIQDLTSCVEMALAKCDDIQADRLTKLNLVLNAAAELSWFDEAAEPKPTTNALASAGTTETASSTDFTDEPVSTSVATAESKTDTEPTSETSSTETPIAAASTEHSTTPSEASTEMGTASTEGPHGGVAKTNAIGALIFLAVGLLLL